MNTKSNIKSLGKTVDGRPMQANQAELLKQYREAYKRLSRKNLKTILELRAKFEAKGMVI